MTDLKKIIKVFNETKIKFILKEGNKKRGKINDNNKYERIEYDTVIYIENDNGVGGCGYVFEIFFKNGKRIMEGVYI